MAKIIVNAGLVSGLISDTLRRTGDFLVTTLPDASPNALEDACREVAPDMLLMNVGLFPEHVTMLRRRKQIEDLHKQFPKCKIMLLIDRNIGDDKFSIAVTLKLAGLIDYFFDCDCDSRYIAATLQSIII